MPDTARVTQLLADLREGRPRAVDDLLPLVYDELKALAGRQFLREAAGHTLQPTALVHEAYMHLVDQDRASYKDRQHFFAVAATVMRRILIDHARARGRLKRGGEHQRVDLDDLLESYEAETGIDLLALDDSLSRLGRLDARKAKLVELRFFGGMTVEEAAGVLEVSPKTVKREWAVAKGWLYRDMTGQDATDG